MRGFPRPSRQRRWLRDRRGGSWGSLAPQQTAPAPGQEGLAVRITEQSRPPGSKAPSTGQGPLDGPNTARPGPSIPLASAAFPDRQPSPREQKAPHTNKRTSLPAQGLCKFLLEVNSGPKTDLIYAQGERLGTRFPTVGARKFFLPAESLVQEESWTNWSGHNQSGTCRRAVSAGGHRGGCHRNRRTETHSTHGRGRQITAWDTRQDTRPVPCSVNKAKRGEDGGF